LYALCGRKAKPKVLDRYLIPIQYGTKNYCIQKMKALGWQPDAMKARSA
jgi:hypothetical protein